jgi:hypothetical protein
VKKRDVPLTFLMQISAMIKKVGYGRKVAVGDGVLSR